LFVSGDRNCRTSSTIKVVQSMWLLLHKNKHIKSVWIAIKRKYSLCTSRASWTETSLTSNWINHGIGQNGTILLGLQFHTVQTNMFYLKCLTSGSYNRWSVQQPLLWLYIRQVCDIRKNTILLLY
jgi:hypothetical protein